MKAGLARGGWGQGRVPPTTTTTAIATSSSPITARASCITTTATASFADVTEFASLVQGSSLGHGVLVLRLRSRWPTRSRGHGIRGVRSDQECRSPAAAAIASGAAFLSCVGLRGLPPGRNFLFHNEGGGKFKDVSESSGIGKRTGCYGFTVLASDFDNDGKPDLYVACDSTPSLSLQESRRRQVRGDRSRIRLGVQRGWPGTGRDGSRPSLIMTKTAAWTSSRQISARTCRTCITTMATERSKTASYSQVSAATPNTSGWGGHLGGHG